ncbi:apolipoprotein N-acyltransferase, partial [Sphingomonas sp. Leaf412]|uniref:apolipoprotein N-acyltransferase n=1 Tax=Sphingomonas sp. Leaf412 TaxID=1736370 RepID=UPI001F359E01
RRPVLDTAWILLFAAAWIVSEWLRSWVFTGYAWDPLGVAWLGLPIDDVALLGRDIGTYALSGLMMVAAGAILLLATRRRWPLAVALMALLAVQVVRTGGETPIPADPASPRLVVVQPNVPQDQRGESDQAMMLARLTRLSGRPGPAPRLVLWPEGVMRDLLETDYPIWAYGATSPWLTRARLASVLGPRDVLMTGGDALRFDAAGNLVAATNSVFVLDAQRRIRARYDKAHLVPYGEYLPMPWLLKPLGLARLVPGEMDYLPGPGPRTIDVPGFGAIGVQICYEIIFSGKLIDPAHRPRLIFNPSNDAWFGTWGSPQFVQQGRMRAIEEGLPLVHATPNGVSAVIAADGSIVAKVGHRLAGAIDVPLPPAHPPTLFSRLGNWAAGIVVALLISAAIALRRRAR